jgi:hypothetical protein
MDEVDAHPVESPQHIRFREYRVQPLVGNAIAEKTTVSPSCRWNPLLLTCRSEGKEQAKNEKSKENIGQR